MKCVFLLDTSNSIPTVRSGLGQHQVGNQAYQLETRTMLSSSERDNMSFHGRTALVICEKIGFCPTKYFTQSQWCDNIYEVKQSIEISEAVGLRGLCQLVCNSSQMLLLAANFF